MPNLKYKLFIVFIVFLSVTLPGQTQTLKIDSLKNIISTRKVVDSSYVDLHIKLSAELQFHDLEQAKLYAKRAVEIATQNNFLYLKAKAGYRLSRILIWNTERTEALKTCLETLAIARENNFKEIEAEAYETVGYIHELDADYSGAIDNYLIAYRIAAANNFPQVKALSIHGLGSIYRIRNEIDKAISHLKEAIGLYKGIDNPDRMASAYQDLAKTNAANKNVKEALMYADSAIYIFTSLQEPYQIADGYFVKGDIATGFRLYNLAKECFNKSLFIYSHNQISENNKHTILLSIAYLEYYQGKNRESEKLVDEVLRHFRKTQDDAQILNALKLKLKIDSAQGNYKDAFYAANEINKISQILFSKNSADVAERLLIEYNVEKKEKEALLIKQEYLANKKMLWLTSVAVTLLSLAAILLFILFKKSKIRNKKIEKLQAETEYQNEELKKLNKVKERLLSMFAHDIRSPLASLLNLVSLSKNKIIKEAEFVELANMVEQDAQKLMLMLDETLIWAKNQMSGHQLNKTTFNLHSITNQVIDILNPIALQKNLTIINQVPENLDVFSDKDCLIIVLRNFLSNAIKFSPKNGKIYFETVVEESKVKILVIDEGKGLTKDAIDKILHKEYFSTLGTENEKGTGLGLRFCQDIIKLLGEEFIIQNHSSKGAEFGLTISKA